MKTTELTIVREGQTLVGCNLSGFVLITGSGMRDEDLKRWLEDCIATRILPGHTVTLLREAGTIQH